MLSRNEARAWAEIERRLVQDRDTRSPVWARLLNAVPVQTLVPLVLAAVAALLGLPVPAFLLLFLVPVGPVVHMTQNMPPQAPSRDRPLPA